MDQLDFDFYLFRDRASGDDALLERRSDGSYRLTRIGATTNAGSPTMLALERAEHAPPTLGLDEAIERIGGVGSGSSSSPTRLPGEAACCTSATTATTG